MLILRERGGGRERGKNSKYTRDQLPELIRKTRTHLTWCKLFLMVTGTACTTRASHTTDYFNEKQRNRRKKYSTYSDKIYVLTPGRFL